MAVAASLLGLEKRSLREQALAALRRAITSGELAQGQHLVETELSEMLGISRGTLREALRQLQDIMGAIRDVADVVNVERVRGL